jgi:long-subunit acyl-CoA synthetase (AMP-forming)
MNLPIAHNGTKMWIRYVCLSYLMCQHMYHQFASSLRQLLHFCQMFCMLSVCSAAAVWCDVDDFIRSAVTGAPLVCHLLALWQADCDRVWLHATEERNVFLPMVHVFYGLFLQVAEHNMVWQPAGITDTTIPRSINSILLTQPVFYCHGSASCCNACLAEMFAEKYIKNFLFSNCLLCSGTIWGPNSGWNAEIFSVPTVRWRCHTPGLTQSPWQWWRYHISL